MGLFPVGRHPGAPPALALCHEEGVGSTQGYTQLS